MIKAILLDFNGVLIDDEPVQMKAYQEVLKGEGIDLTIEEYYSALGMDDQRFVEAAFKRVGKEPDAAKVAEIVQGKNQKWRETISNELPFFNGMENFVKKMANQFTLGIVSMAGRAEIDFVLEKSGLVSYFSAIISSESVPTCKPDPECYRLGFKMIDSVRTSRGHLPMTHGECLAIEDSPPGIIAARNADLPTLGVTNTVSSDELRAAGAESVAADLNDWAPESVRRVFA